jgi:signal transduction histidine kinase
MTRVVRRRAFYLAPLLVTAAVLDLIGTFGVSWDDYAVLLALVASAEAGRWLVGRLRRESQQIAVFEAFFAVEVLLIAWTTWWMSGTRWLGPTALLVELGFANVALPRASAQRITGLAVVCYLAIVWGEVLGIVRSNHSFGVPDYAGNVHYAIVTSVSAIVLVAFFAFAQRQFAEILRSQEAASQRRQQLETLGRLAAGVAHDINNVLTAVELTADDLAASPASPADTREAVADLRDATRRGQGLMRQLLDYARSADTPVGSADVSRVLERLRPMLQRLAARADLVLEPMTVATAVPLDATRVEQIITNLVVNAHDASEGPARIVVSVRVWTAPVPDAAPITASAPRPLVVGRAPDTGRGVCVSVTDNGTGIAPAVLPDVLAPFFTTKAEGRGTGLGLATVQSLAQSVDGDVRISTTPGIGTRVEVFLPATAGG